MASVAYSQWLAAGQPYTRARPMLELLTLLRRYGYTVYDYPNDAHLKAEPPEDHTPFSATGWPVTSKHWVGHADDVMPPNATATAKGAVDLVTLAKQIIADKDAKVAGTSWLKYINWTDENGRCWHTSWQPDKRTVSSTDTGHIHMSARSDMDTSDEVSRTGWDPVERSKKMADSLITYNTGWFMQLGVIGLEDPVIIPKNAAVPGSGSSTPNELAKTLDALESSLANTNGRIDLMQVQLDKMNAKLDVILAKLDQGGGGTFPPSSTFTSSGTVIWNPPE